MTVEKIAYKGWPNCYRLSNALVDLIVTTDVGPRIIRFGFIHAENEFQEYEEMLGKTGGNTWRMYGGHRLWHAPEAMPRTYFPDNAPVTLEEHTDFIRLIQPTETTTGIQKEMDIHLDPNTAHVQVTHRLRNRNVWAVELAPWAPTVMAQGGKAIIPLPPRGSHEENLLPTSTIALWAYTDMSDPRWTWGAKYVMLQQDPARVTPQKVGLLVPDGWVACARNGHLFIKKFAYSPGAPYPHLGCCVETFTDATMIEVETAGPLVRLQPDTTVEHIEHWFLFRDVPVPQTDQDVDQHVLPRVQAARVF